MPTAHDPLEALVVELLERIAAGAVPDAALAEVCAAHAELDGALRKRAALMAEFGMLASTPRADIPERLGEFVLRGRLGGGGMGVVFLAEQERLGRQVALKVVHPGQLLFPGARERFRREVEVVARLHHPGIVPVHAVGEQDGIPYLVMERVRGCSLAELLAALAGRDPRLLVGADMAAALRRVVADAGPPGEGYVFEGSWEAACLRVVRQVADALQHAHGRGVVHRDVKPSNVMITPDGRAQLVDFGLASAEGSDSLTRTGSPLGSLPYMSPEQTRGELRGADPRTDVYGLGVLLYELLTLRPAFGGGSAAGIVLAIQQGRREPPRALNPALSWEAATVCLTAMDPDPARRYAGAADLSRDLANVLERRPLEARRAGAWLAARRWVQRHPTASVAAAFGVLLLVGGPAAWAWQQHRAAVRLRAEQDLTRQQRDRAEQAALLAGAERQRAEAHLENAVAAVDTMLVRVGDDALRDVAQMQALRRALLDDAVAFHRRFLEREGEDPRLVVATSRALQYSGDAHLDTGDAVRAEELYREAVAVLEGVLAGAPGHAPATTELGRSLRRLAAAVSQRGAAHEATALTLRAIELQRALTADDDDSREERFLLGTSLLTRAATGQRAEPAAAEEAAREAASIFAALADETPEDTRVRYQHGVALSHVATLAGVQGRVHEARRCYDEAIAVLEGAIAAQPESVAARQELARTLVLAANLVSEDDGARARGLAERAAHIYADLVRDFPETPAHRSGQAQCLIALANLSALADDWPAVVDRLRQAEGAQLALVQGWPEDPDLRLDLAANRCSLSQALLQVDELDRALAAAEQAVAVAHGLVAGQPDDPGYVAVLSLAEAVEGNAHAAAGQLDEAEASLARAVAAMEQALLREPGNAAYRQQLVSERTALEAVRGASAAAAGP